MNFEIYIEKVKEKVSASTFANDRSKKHFSAFEMPIIVDLKNEKLLFYNQTPLWGKIYYEFFREYIEEKYNIKGA